MSQCIFGFDQKKAVSYNFTVAELAVLRWFCDFHAGAAAKVSDEMEAGNKEYESEIMKFIVHPETGERYYWVDMSYAHKQLPILSVSSRVFAEIWGRLCGEFPKGAKIIPADKPYPLKRYYSSVTFAKRVYFRITSALQDLMTSDNVAVQEGMDKWNTPRKDKPVVPSLMEDKVGLSESFLSLYNDINNVHDFGHRLPVTGGAPSKTLLQAQKYVDQVLGGTFLSSNKFDPMQDTAGYVADKDAIIRAVQRYAAVRKESESSYNFNLPGFFFNPMTGKSMFLSMLIADRYPKKQAINLLDRKDVSREADMLLHRIELNALLPVDGLVCRRAEDLSLWWENNNKVLRLINGEERYPLTGWGDFVDVFVEFLKSWGDKASVHHLKIGNGIWKLFLTFAHQHRGWNLEPSEKLVARMEKRAKERMDDAVTKAEMEKKARVRKLARDEFGESLPLENALPRYDELVQLKKNGTATYFELMELADLEKETS